MTPLYWIAFHIVALWAICLTATRYDCHDRLTATLGGVAFGLNIIALGVRVCHYYGSWSRDDLLFEMEGVDGSTKSRN